MSGVSLDKAPASMEGYACPFCTVEISEQRGPATSPALLAFEAHLDFHMARGDQLRVKKPYLVRGTSAA